MAWIQPNVHNTGTSLVGKSERYLVDQVTDSSSPAPPALLSVGFDGLAQEVLNPGVGHTRAGRPLIERVRTVCGKKFLQQINRY
jgi:hypothetical protein